VREGIERNAPLAELAATWAAEERDFRRRRAAWLLYA
jgi:hypothetical protein